VSRDLRFDELRTVLLSLADLATSVAETPAVFGENSRSHSDLDSPYQFTLKAARSLTFGAEMVRGISNLLPVSDVVLCRFALVRPAIVAAARTSYLTDATIDTTERIRRWANMTIESRVESANCYPPDHPDRARLERELDDWEHLATQLGHRLTTERKRPGLVPKRTIGTPMYEMAIVRRSSGVPQPHEALAVYRLSSSILHDVDYGQLMHYDPAVADPSVPLDELTFSIASDSKSAWAWFGHPALDLLRAVGDFSSHQGYNCSDEISGIARVLTTSIRRNLAPTD
jgi:hypothetical protein